MTRSTEELRCKRDGCEFVAVGETEIEAALDLADHELNDHGPQRDVRLFESTEAET